MESKSPLATGADLLLETAEGLIREGLLTEGSYPVTLNRVTRYLVHVEPIHLTNDRFAWFTELPDGIYLERRIDVKSVVRLCVLLLENFEQGPGQFHVRLSQLA